MNTSRSDLHAVTPTPRRAPAISAVCTAREASLHQTAATRRPCRDSASADRLGATLRRQRAAFVGEPGLDEGGFRMTCDDERRGAVQVGHGVHQTPRRQACSALLSTCVPANLSVQGLRSGSLLIWTAIMITATRAADGTDEAEEGDDAEDRVGEPDVALGGLLANVALRATGPSPSDDFITHLAHGLAPGGLRSAREAAELENRGDERGHDGVGAAAAVPSPKPLLRASRWVPSDGRAQ